MSSKIEVTVETVTPAKAEKWLNANKNNRRLRPGIAEKYANDMSAGKWTQNVDPVVFYDNGDIADGQHRLFAIIESGTTQTFIIVRNLDRASGLNIDVGLNRNLVDNARISGSGVDLSNELIATARSVAEGNRQNKPYSNAERLAFVVRFEEECRWACANGPRGRGLRNAVILAAVARAYTHENDKDRLNRFCDVMTTGMAESKSESAAVALRNYFLITLNGNVRGSQWREAFLKCQNAIWYFMQGAPLSVIKGVKEEKYPLLKTRKKFRNDGAK